MSKKPITITAPMESGEIAYFKIIPTGTLEQLWEDLEMVVSPQCVWDLSDMGCLEIV